MSAARNQEVTVRRPEAKSMPVRRMGTRAALRQSSQEPKRAKVLDNQSGRCEDDMAGPSVWASFPAVILAGGPALGHPCSPPASLLKLRTSLIRYADCEKVAESAICGAKR